MFDTKSPDSSSSTLRLGLLLAALVWAMAAASYALAAEPGWSLAVGTATAAPQTAVELPIALTSGSAPVSAIAFSLEFDSTKLVLDADPKLGSKVEIPAPTRFISSSWVGDEAGTIGVAVYDGTRPIGTLEDGTIAKVRFRVLAGASGFAAVRVSRSRPFSAAGERGEPLEGTIADGGIAIAASSGASLPIAGAVSPGDSPDALPREEAPRVDERHVYVIPLAAGSSLIVHNRSDSAAAMSIALLGDEALSVDIRVPAGATQTWDDPAWRLFGVTSSSGAIVVEAAHDGIMVARAEAAGAPEVAPPAGSDDALLLDVEAGVPHLIAIANVATSPARFALETRDAAGALLDIRYADVAPRSVAAVPVKPVASLGGTLLIRSLDGAPYAAWDSARDATGLTHLRFAR
jgi:hypothetical protein